MCFLRNQYEFLQKENDILRKRIKTLEHQSTISEINAAQFKQLAEKFVSPAVATFIEVQLTESKKQARGRRYSEDLKKLCLAIYFSGPKSYRQHLMKIFCLPTPRTLLKQIQGIQLKPSLDNPQLFEMLKIKVECLQENDKYVLLCFDEMSMKANLFYDRSHDNLIGLAHNEKGECTFQPALSAFVLMIKGIQSRWKQPLLYLFSHTTCSSNSIKYIIEQVVLKLKTIGLKICAITSDMGSNNIQYSNSLQISPEKPFFHVEEQKIFYIFDVPHILKAVRNMLLQNDFYFEEKRISWKYIEIFYNHNKKYSINDGSKILSDSHIRPSNFEKMKVKFAAQVFSESVCRSMSLYLTLGFLPSEAIHTCEFILRMDKLFDILNSSRKLARKKHNCAFKGLEHQMEFLQDCLRFFDKLKVKNNKNQNITAKIKCFKALKITINSVIGLWTDLQNSNFEFLYTRRLNQDALENYFGKIRQQNGNCFNPTPIQFVRSSRKLLCLDLLHSGTENCEADTDLLILKLKDVPKEPNTEKVVTSTIINQQIPLDFQTFDILEQNFFKYVCGYLLKKGLDKHTCDICISYANTIYELDDSLLFCYLKAYENASKDTYGNLKIPHNDFVDFISHVEFIFRTNFEKFILKNRVCESFLNLISDTKFSHPCQHFPTIFIIKLFIRVRLYYTLKKINKNFKNTNRNKMIIWQHL